MDGNGQKWLEMTMLCCNWLEMAENDWKQLVIAYKNSFKKEKISQRDEGSKLGAS